MADLNRKLIVAMRKIFRDGAKDYKARYEALKRCKVAPKTFACETCNKESQDVYVDHITPVVPPDLGFTNISDFFVRLFVGSDQLQVLCKKCHDLKTQSEDLIRKQFKTGRYKKRGKRTAL